MMKKRMKNYGVDDSLQGWWEFEFLTGHVSDDSFDFTHDRVINGPGDRDADRRTEQDRWHSEVFWPDIEFDHASA
jgi:hypothetical protein